MLDKLNEYLENTIFVDIEEENIYRDLSITKEETIGKEIRYYITDETGFVLVASNSLETLWEKFKQHYNILSYVFIHDLDEID